LERGGNEEKEFQTSSGASGVAQVAEHLFNKPEAQYCKKKKKQKNPKTAKLRLTPAILLGRLRWGGSMFKASQLVCKTLSHK
jgi:hypothetical protein